MDWLGLMRLGLRDLRLMPMQFWALTPVELMIMAGRDGAGAPMNGRGLAALAAAYPDKPIEETGDG